MIADVVVDNNILMHAGNRIEPRREHCVRLIAILRDANTLLCIDEGFHPVEARNKSQIGSEYFRHLRFGSLGFAIVQHLAKFNRVRQVTRKVPSQVSRKLLQQGITGVDRVYVMIAYNSDAKVLASHDFGDLPARVRRQISNDLDIRIVDANQAAELLE